MAKPAKYDPSASIVSPPDPELDPESVTVLYATPLSAPVYTTAPSDPVPVPVPVTVPFVEGWRRTHLTFLSTAVRSNLYGGNQCPG